MPHIRRSSLAEQDLTEILLYVGAEDRSPAGALKLLETFEKAFALYASNPQLGTSCAELASNLRLFTCGTKSNSHGWSVFYRPIDDGIEIVRVLRSTRDFTKLFE